MHEFTGDLGGLKQSVWQFEKCSTPVISTLPVSVSKEERGPPEGDSKC